MEECEKFRGILSIKCTNFSPKTQARPPRNANVRIKVFDEQKWIWLPDKFIQWTLIVTSGKAKLEWWPRSGISEEHFHREISGSKKTNKRFPSEKKGATEKPWGLKIFVITQNGDAFLRCAT